MANCSCFWALVGRNKKYKRKEKFRKTAQVHPPIEGPIEVSGSLSNKVKEKSHESSLREAKETVYKGEDEHDESMLMNRDSFDFDIHNIKEEYGKSVNKTMNLRHPFNNYVNDQYETKSDEEVMEITNIGNTGDPVISRREFWTSIVLKRSCSNLAMRDTIKKISFDPPPSESRSFEEIQRLALKLSTRSPVSVSSHYSADKVMLRKHSSSHILPSRSRKLWWKLFLWSHRFEKGTSNTQQQLIPVKIIVRKQGGYTSDTLEPGKGMDLNKQGSPGSFTRNSLERESNNNGNHVLHDIHIVTSLWPRNLWVACPAESCTFSRVDEWIKDLSIRPPRLIEDETEFPPSPRSGKSLAGISQVMTKRPNTNVPKDVLHANNVIQCLNSSSTVAHVAGTGLKVNPAISHFSSLRSVNLSGNSIVQITQGSLPKSLQVLNLSRNNIHTIEGLKELTRLRVLDLSYNRISQIGRGLSNCTLIKELYLTANKISYVEGLHRLLKLTVLDLSFNKITTTNALRQLVANYNSIIALNLLGNPIQSISEDQLRKTMCSLLRKLVFLNKQPINLQKAREQVVVEPTLANKSWNTRRKTTRKLNLGNFASSKMHKKNSLATQRCRHRLKSKTQSQSSKAILSSLASPSH